MNGCPHGHVCGVFGSFHPYLRCNPSLNSDLLKKNCIFLRVARLANSMLLSATLICSHFFSNEQFSILLAFFECDNLPLSFDVSIYQKLFGFSYFWITVF